MNWTIKEPSANADTLAQQIGKRPEVAQVLINRGCTTFEEMNRVYKTGIFPSDILSYAEMPNAYDKAYELVKTDSPSNKILIVGDYDVDGTMSTYILTHGLRRVLKSDIQYFIPSRINDGYGLSNKIVDYAKQNSFNIILTCDNGTQAIPAINHAMELGIPVIVTDHHQPQDNYYNEAVNPYCFDLPHYEMCGATVALKFLNAVYDILQPSDGDLTCYFQYAALATMADLITIDPMSRELIRLGIKQIKGVECSYSIRDLLSQANLNPYTANFNDIKIRICPMLNAVGRVADATLVVDFLLEQDSFRRSMLARDIFDKNELRKELTHRALDQAEFTTKSVGEVFKILHLTKDVAGVGSTVANSILDKDGKAVITFIDCGDEYRGSVRSNFKLGEFLQPFKKLCTDFGGHNYAAGFTAPKENYIKLLDIIADIKASDVEYESMSMDMELDPWCIDFKLYSQLEELAPYNATNFTQPVFCVKNASISDVNLLGKKANLCRCEINDVTAKCFINASQFYHDAYYSKELDIAYKIEKNSWQGRSSIELVIVDWKESDA